MTEYEEDYYYVIRNNMCGGGYNDNIYESLLAFISHNRIYFITNMPNDNILTYLRILRTTNEICINDELHKLINKKIRWIEESLSERVIIRMNITNKRIKIPKKMGRLRLISLP